MYLAAFVLLVIGTLTDDGSVWRAWGLFLALGATSWMCYTLHAYSRRVILEVMSWEHRQQGMPTREELSLVDGRR
jgi:hypothetical protein